MTTENSEVVTISAVLREAGVGRITTRGKLAADGRLVSCATQDQVGELGVFLSFAIPGGQVLNLCLTHEAFDTLRKALPDIDKQLARSKAATN